MFDVEKGCILNVSYARKGKKQDGTPYCMLKFLERDNQPDDLPNPSRSYKPLYAWFEGAEFPDAIKGIKDHGKVKLIDFTGFQSYAGTREIDGKTVYREELRLKNPIFEMA